ncbi:MAG: dTDP-4-dehydrorhamnose 3,5-epimerase family protein [Hyphomicrobiales bacterium]
MKIVATPFPQTALIALEPKGDERGFFLRSFDREFFSILEMPVDIDHTAESINPNAYTLRGLHFQKPPYTEQKLIRCLKGKIFEVAVDLRRGSPTEGRAYHITLSEEDDHALFLPKGIAHGFLTLQKDSVVSYHLFDPYHAEAAFGIRYDDEALDIPWPHKPHLINERDRAWPLLKDLKPEERPSFR